MILEEGLSVNARKLKPEVLVGLLGSHVLEFHGSQVEWMELVMFISDKAGVKIPIIEEAKKCKVETVPGQKINLYGIPAPQGRCTFMELLLIEILSTRQNIAVRECYSSTNSSYCAAMSSQVVDELQMDIVKGKLIKFMTLDALFRAQSLMQEVRNKNGAL